MIRTWKITQSSPEEIQLNDRSSLDAITRQLPEGYYSTFRTYDGCRRVLGLASHLRRLYGPVPQPGVDASTLRRNLLPLLDPYRSLFGPAGEARVRVMMTKEGEVFIAIEPLKLLPGEVYERGVRVETVEMQRNTPRLKSTAFIGQSDDERRHIARAGIFEALLVKNGRVLEGMTSNFFYVLPVASTSLRSTREVPMHFRERGIVCTAQRDILLGITRRNVIRVARASGIEVRYRPLNLDHLPAVKEAFITSSSRGIVPVIRIDETTVGDGKPGPVTKQLSAAYEAYVLRKAERI
ncbi:MAG: hypothetical protein C3F07_19165 [Anaerolineales bacterium]|nr:MAG: hypothetical protein C3F07_19165 [Anaerolineales bacterium]